MSLNPDPESLGTRLRALRQNQRQTLQQVADAVGGLAPEHDDGWSAERPTTGGWWLWREAAYREPVALRLTEDGTEVAQPPDEEDCEGTPQYYWEQTLTDKAHMPGLWKRA